MENWVEADRISIPEYDPQLLGARDDAALAGLIQRMDELIDFSKTRGQKLRILVEIGNRPAVQPVALECALETSRVTADLLHTVGHLAKLPATNHATLRGRVNIPAALELERLPAKVILVDTAFSTLADLSGNYEFRHLPPGTYEVKAWRAGTFAKPRQVTLEEGKTNVCSLEAAIERNLIRNGDFELKWLKAKGPDCWYETQLGWEGEIIPLKNGQRYRLEAAFREGAEGDVFVRWTQMLPHLVPQNIAMPKIESKPLTPTDNMLEFAGTEKMALLQVTLRTKKLPGDLCSRVRLLPINDAE